AFWPANTVCDDVHVYSDDTRTKEIATFYFLRQQMQKPAGQFNHCLADYIAPANSQLSTINHRLADYLGGFAVSIHGADELAEEFSMHSGSSGSGLYFSHPDSKYFGVGQIGRDQVTDYATRRSEAISAVEKRLASNLGPKL